MKYLSVIIPAYNVEKYISKTLTSLTKDKVINEKIEILVVNDGSKDKTVEITKEFMKKYPDTVSLINKQNGGHGSTINKGIEMATGIYFKVVDGDDWVDSKEFSGLVNNLEKCTSDLIICHHCEVRKDILTKKRYQSNLEFNNNYLMKNLDQLNFIPMHDLTIRTEILKENNIRLDEHCFYVDREYILYPIPYVKSICLYDLYVYMYRLGDQNQSVSIKSYQKNREQHKKVTFALVDFYNNHNYINKTIDQYAYHMTKNMIDLQYLIYFRMPINSLAKNELIQFDRMLLNNGRNFYLSVSRKVIILRKFNFHGLAIIKIFMWIKALLRGEKYNIFS